MAKATKGVGRSAKSKSGPTKGSAENYCSVKKGDFEAHL